jgi:hypothetical protein
MTVTPAAEPKPALAYRFVAQDIGLKPGNSAPYYYRALLDLPHRMEVLQKKYPYEETDKWEVGDEESMPISQLPVDKVQDAIDISLGGAVWDQLREATQRRYCDFELGIPEIRGPELISVLLEEFQRSRQLSRMLALRGRLHTAKQEYGQAVDTMRMNYRLARDFGSQPFIVSGLIGIAEAGHANATALELMAAPNSPNLYWALTELPDPVVDLREAIRMELDFGPRMFPFLDKAETTDHSPEEWNRLFTKTFADLQFAGAPVSVFGITPSAQDKAANGLFATAVGLLGYTHAKERLIAGGMDKDRVEKMSVGQVMAIYSERNYRDTANSFEVLWYMPFWESRERADEIEGKLANAGMASGSENRELLPMVSLLMPAMQAARGAQVRSEREIAAMRVIEALRMHAAENSDKLPATLADITAVPVPLNPATGEPFVYRLEGDTAILELPASDGIPNNTRRFEIQIAK